MIYLLNFVIREAMYKCCLPSKHGSNIYPSVHPVLDQAMSPAYGLLCGFVDFSRVVPGSLPGSLVVSTMNKSLRFQKAKP
jgi:hypothetical protein